VRESRSRGCGPNRPGAAGGGSGLPLAPLAPLSTLGQLRPAPDAGALGPEAVDGIGCQSSEQTVFHIHAHLTIFDSPGRAGNDHLPGRAVNPQRTG
jgi:hypothetical protein